MALKCCPCISQLLPSVVQVVPSCLHWRYDLSEWVPCNFTSAAARIPFMLCCYWGQVLSGSLLGRDGYKSSWPFDYMIFSLFFCNWKLHFIWNPFYNYFRVIRLLRIDFTSNHFLTASSDKSIRFFAIFVFPPFWFLMTFFIKFCARCTPRHQVEIECQICAMKQKYCICQRHNGTRH